MDLTHHQNCLDILSEAFHLQSSTYFQERGPPPESRRNPTYNYIAKWVRLHSSSLRPEISNLFKIKDIVWLYQKTDG